MKITQTINDYCEEEFVDIINIENVMLTGGGMNLGSLEG